MSTSTMTTLLERAQSAPETTLSVAVLIPTFQRPDDLRRCLTALQQQSRLPDQVVVVCRVTDTLTREFLERFDARPLEITVALVDIGGVVAAMNRGLGYVTQDLLAITDDDTAPHADWIEKIERYFRGNDRLGGLGGRDWQPVERDNRPTVGKVQWFGRVIGNHHLGYGPAREVDIVKGANCAYRTELVQRIGFDTRLKGAGAQAHWEMSLCLALKRQGWSLVYDPEVSIDHFPARRFDNDQLVRGRFNAEALFNSVYNETLALMEHLTGLRRTSFVAWAYLVGTCGHPGLLQAPRLAATRPREASERLRASLAGRRAAIDDWRNSRKAVES